MKSFTNFLITISLGILTVLVLSALINASSTAPAQDVKAIVDSTKSDPAETELVRKFLTAHPEPSNLELEGLRKELNQHQVLAVSEAATGLSRDKLVKPARPQAVEPDPFTQLTYRWAMFRKNHLILAWGLAILLCAVIFHCLVRMFRRNSEGY